MRKLNIDFYKAGIKINNSKEYILFHRSFTTFDFKTFLMYKTINEYKTLVLLFQSLKFKKTLGN